MFLKSIPFLTICAKMRKRNQVPQLMIPTTNKESNRKDCRLNLLQELRYLMKWQNSKRKWTFLLQENMIKLKSNTQKIKSKKVLWIKLRIALSFKAVWEIQFKCLELVIIMLDFKKGSKVRNGCLKKLKREVKARKESKHQIWEVIIPFNMDYSTQYLQDHRSKELILEDNKDSEVEKEKQLLFTMLQANGVWRINWTRKIFCVGSALQWPTIQYITDIFISE